MPPARIEVPGLVVAKQGWENAALFELGPRFEDAKPGAQVLIACALRSGHTSTRHWAGTRRSVDAFDAAELDV